MCQEITLKLPDGSLREFTAKSKQCNCVLGQDDEPQHNAEFARWVLGNYEDARTMGDGYEPKVILTIF